MAGTNIYAAGATPRFIAHGAEDLSIRLAPMGEEEVPQHLPIFYILSDRGPLKDQIVDNAAAKALYGVDVFNQDSEFYKHSNLFAEGCLQAGQMIMMKRLVPSGVERRANVALYADMIKRPVPNYKRDSKGGVMKDNLGNPIVDEANPTVPGLAIKWIADYGTGDEPTQAGLLEAREGTMEYTTHTEEDHPTEMEWREVGTGVFEKKMVGTGKFEKKQVGTGRFEKRRVGLGTFHEEEYDTGRTEKKMVDTGRKETRQVGTGRFEKKMVDTGRTERKEVGTGVFETKRVKTGTEERRTPIPEKGTETLTDALFDETLKNKIKLIRESNNPTGVLKFNKVSIKWDVVGDEDLLTAAAARPALYNKLMFNAVGDNVHYLNAADAPADKPLTSNKFPDAIAELQTLVTENVKNTINKQNIQDNVDIVSKNTLYVDIATNYPAGFLTYEELDALGVLEFVHKVDADLTIPDEKIETVDKYEDQQVEIMEERDVPIMEERDVEIMEDREFPVMEERDVPIMGKRQVEDTEERDVEITEEKDVEIMEEREVEKTELKYVPKKIMVAHTTKSRMIPVFEIIASYFGSGYNNYGFSINSHYLEDFNSTLAKNLKLYPYTVSMYTRKNKKASPSIMKTLYYDNEAELVLTNKVVKDPSLGARCDLSYVIAKEWFNEKDPIYPYVPNVFDSFRLYDKNFEEVLKAIFEAEKNSIEFEPKLYTTDNAYGKSIDWYDFDASKIEDIEEQLGLFNPFTAKTSKNVRLQNVIISEDRPTLSGNLKEINMSANKPIFMDGGNDGNITDVAFEEAVVAELAKYADENSDVQELAYNVESTFWDSGFTLPTKLAIGDFISVRKDTYVVLSTHVVGEKPLPLSKMRARGVSLDTNLRLNPESTFYGTPTCRGLIVGGAYHLSNSNYTEYVPLSYDLLVKTARFAGAANGKWKREYIFDHGDNAVIRTGTDIVPEFIPHGVKPALWSANLIYPQKVDRKNYFFPALQTVYGNDTSVLNSYFTIMALCTITKSGHKTWKHFSGAITFTNAQFKLAVEDYMIADLADRFAGIITATAICEITDKDKLRGYSYKLYGKLYANNMKTVCEYTTRVYRAEDLEK